MGYPDRYYATLRGKFLEALAENPTDTDGAIRKLIEFHDVEHSLVWDTTCRGCADLMDKLYERDVRDGLI